MRRARNIVASCRDRDRVDQLEAPGYVAVGEIELVDLARTRLAGAVQTREL